MMEYFNLVTEEREEYHKIAIRRGRKSDVKDPQVKTPLYAITFQDGARFAYSNMGLIHSLITHLQGLRRLVESDIEIESKKNLYPDRDPYFISKTIIELHNNNLWEHCVEIEENPNIFDINLHRKRFITPKQIAELQRV